VSDAQVDPRLLAALAPGSSAPVGEFVYDVSDRHWWWSDDLYALYGFAPGEVVPSDELIARHVHPEDRDVPDPTVPQALRTGRPFTSLHRIVDARRRERTLLTVGQPVLDDEGATAQLRGYVVDLTLANRAAAQIEVDAAVAGVTVHRAAIEQAKGVVMALEGVTGEAAFGLLRDYSQQHNVKLRVLAERLVAALDRVERPATREQLDAVVASLSGDVDGLVLH